MSPGRTRHRHPVVQNNSLVSLLKTVVVSKADKMVGKQAGALRQQDRPSIGENRRNVSDPKTTSAINGPGGKNKFAQKTNSDLKAANGILPQRANYGLTASPVIFQNREVSLKVVNTKTVRTVYTSSYQVVSSSTAEINGKSVEADYSSGNAVFTVKFASRPKDSIANPESPGNGATAAGKADEYAKMLAILPRLKDIEVLAPVAAERDSEARKVLKKLSSTSSESSKVTVREQPLLQANYAHKHKNPEEKKAERLGPDIEPTGAPAVRSSAVAILEPTRLDGSSGVMKTPVQFTGNFEVVPPGHSVIIALPSPVPKIPSAKPSRGVCAEGSYSGSVDQSMDRGPEINLKRKREGTPEINQVNSLVSHSGRTPESAPERCLQRPSQTAPESFVPVRYETEENPSLESSGSSHRGHQQTTGNDSNESERSPMVIEVDSDDTEEDRARKLANEELVRRMAHKSRRANRRRRHADYESEYDLQSSQTLQDEAYFRSLPSAMRRREGFKRALEWNRRRDQARMYEQNRYRRQHLANGQPWPNESMRTYERGRDERPVCLNPYAQMKANGRRQ